MNTTIGVARGPGGELAYAVPFPPESIPPVPPRALLAAWDTARDAAAACLHGPERSLRFATPPAPAPAAPGTGRALAEVGAPGPEPVEMHLSDPDARCWAEAIDDSLGLGTLSGLSVFLRLLALLDAMGRLPWLRGMFDINAGGTLLHPQLLAAAADLPLDRAARLDETSLRRRLSRLPAGARA
ncbi:hypothetical protein [Roseomonas sp. BN140053]|uniref:hypothetical protein n=1 Tax=Roseomonas sp. BN140053 TaxID=3391898 RepID=UPI0039EA5EEE